MGLPMRRSERIIVILLPVTIMAVVITLFVQVWRSPLRGSETDIRDRLLLRFPLGSSVEEVLGAFDDVREDRSYDEPLDGSGYPYVAGSRLIRTGLGGHVALVDGVPLSADVEAIWGFDGEGRLADVLVRKTVDGL